MSKHTPGPWEMRHPTKRVGYFSLGEERRYITSDPMRERAINYERDARPRLRRLSCWRRWRISSS